MAPTATPRYTTQEITTRVSGAWTATGAILKQFDMDISGYKPDCAGCHAGDYEQNEHKKVDSPRIYYTVSELRNCAGACHEYTDSSMTNN